MSLESLTLRGLALLLVCAIISFMIFFITAWFVALYQVFIAIFTVMSGGLSG